jgi:hypothetical protein
MGHGMQYEKHTIQLLLFLVLAPNIGCNSETLSDKANEQQEIDAVAQCLSQYKAAIKAGDPAMMAPCLIPPMDEWLAALGAQIDANEEFMDVLVEARAIDEDPTRLQAIRQSLNPMSGVSGFEFSDIHVNGNRASAKVVMHVANVAKSSTQRLIRVDGSWRISQGEKDEYSDTDAKELLATSDATKTYAESVRKLADRLKSGDVNGNEALQEFQNLTISVQKQINDIRAANPPKE